MTPRIRRVLGYVLAMKLLSSIALALALAGCGSKPTPTSSPSPGSDPTSSPPSPKVPPQGGLSCEKEIALRCVQGLDGCQGGKTLVHMCVPSESQPGPPCEQEIAQVCPVGQTDACLRTPRVSANHLCVY